MKVLLAGDSITRGTLGKSYVELLALKHPEHRFINHGTDGHTFAAILRRLINHLKIRDDYDYILIQGGYNDILLPSFGQKGLLFRFAQQQQFKKGLKPLTVAELPSFLTESLRQIKRLYKGKLILSTLGCLNEMQSFPLNQQRHEWNKVLREIAFSENILLADCGRVFDQLLKGKPQTDYCLECFWNTTVGDRIACQFQDGAAALSKKRKLRLTIDGIHLNGSGAQVFCECISNSLTAHAR